MFNGFNNFLIFGLRNVFLLVDLLAVLINTEYEPLSLKEEKSAMVGKLVFVLIDCVWLLVLNSDNRPYFQFRVF